MCIDDTNKPNQTEIIPESSRRGITLAVTVIVIHIIIMTIAAMTIIDTTNIIIRVNTNADRSKSIGIIMSINTGNIGIIITNVIKIPCFPLFQVRYTTPKQGKFLDFCRRRIYCSSL